MSFYVWRNFMELGMQNPAQVMPRLENGAVKKGGGHAVTVDRETGKALDMNGKAVMAPWMEQLISAEAKAAGHKVLSSGYSKDALSEELSGINDFMASIEAKQQEMSGQAKAMREKMAARKEVKTPAGRSVQNAGNNPVLSAKRSRSH